MKTVMFLALTMATTITIAYYQGRFDNLPQKVNRVQTVDDDFEMLVMFDRAHGYKLFHGWFGL